MFNNQSMAQHRDNLAELVSDMANAMAAVAAYWDNNNLPGDFSTPETGYPFQLSLDDQVAAVWQWCVKLRDEDPRPSKQDTDMQAEPKPEQITAWARMVMTEVLDMTAEHMIPLGIRTFSQLHDYTDANCFLINAAIPFGSDCITEQDPDGVRFVNAVSDRVQVYLVAVADMLDYDLKLKCTNANHDHTTSMDRRGVDLGYLVPMTCSGCTQPAHYDEGFGGYSHDTVGSPCWMSPDVISDTETPCQPNHTDVSMDAMVDILSRLDITAEVEMTGGGVATLYAGRVIGTKDGDPNWPARQACAGPGWFQAPGYRDARCAFDDFYIGADDNGEDALVPPSPTGFVDAIQKIVARCK